MKAVNSEQLENERQNAEDKPLEIDFKLYLITDTKLFTDNHSLLNGIEEALKGGVRAVQLREKDLGTRELLDMAYRLREITNTYNAKLFINDRADIAVAVEADGVHLGQDCIPPQAVKKISKNRLITGVSTHSKEEAAAAVREGADFITFGPVYSTLSKLKYGEPVGVRALKDVCLGVNIPVFAIGGIKIDMTREIKDSGAYGIAVISAILGSEHIRKSAEEFMELFQ